MESIERAYENLANGIIIVAIQDYNRARINLSKPNINVYKKIQSERTIREVEKFFTSEWFKKLTHIDGEWLLQQVKEGKTKKEGVYLHYE